MGVKHESMISSTLFIVFMDYYEMLVQREVDGKILRYEVKDILALVSESTEALKRFVTTWDDVWLQKECRSVIRKRR